MNQNNGTVNNGVINSTAETLTGKELTGIEKRMANLKNYATMSDDEKRDFARKGGIARGEQQKKQKTLKEQMLVLLNTKVSRETAAKYLGDDAETISDADLTCQAIMAARMWQEASNNGNAKAAEFCRDTSGQAPKMQIDATVETFSESDRALMDKIATRLGILTEKNDG